MRSLICPIGTGLITRHVRNGSVRVCKENGAEIALSMITARSSFFADYNHDETPLPTCKNLRKMKIKLFATHQEKKQKYTILKRYSTTAKLFCSCRF